MVLFLLFIFPLFSYLYLLMFVVPHRSLPVVLFWAMVWNETFYGCWNSTSFLIYSKLFYSLSFTLPLLLQDVWCFMILMYIFTIYHHLFHNMLYCTVNIIVFMKNVQCIYYCYVYRLIFCVKFYKEQNILLSSLLYMHTLSMYRGFSSCILLLLYLTFLYWSFKLILTTYC